MDDPSTPRQIWFHNLPYVFAVALAVAAWVPGTAFLVVTTRRWEEVAFVTVGLVILIPFVAARSRRDAQEWRQRHPPPSP